MSTGATSSANNVASARTRIAFVGDVHCQWSQTDVVALKSLQADMAIFVGDFGEEVIDLVTEVAHIDHPKLVMLGNHDAWTSLTASPRRVGKWRPVYGPGQPNPGEKAIQQIKILGDINLSWNYKPIPNKPVSIVGARPFSKGGTGWKSWGSFYSNIFGVKSCEESAAKTVQVVKQEVPADTATVIVAHNGPTGLGDKASDICGVDFKACEGDHGDPDLRMTLDKLHSLKRHVSVVAFGHMHHVLRSGGQRKMIHLDPETRTLFVNTAVVPRVLNETAASSKHHFCVVDFDGVDVADVCHVWVEVQAESGACSIVESHHMIDRSVDSPAVRRTWNDHIGLWEETPTRKRKAATVN